MNYVYEKETSKVHYANYLAIQDNKRLSWKNPHKGLTFILQGPYEEKLLEKMDEVIEVLNTRELPIPEDEYFEINVRNGLFGRFVSAVEKVGGNGCPIHRRASTYISFGCKKEDNKLTIFPPNKPNRSRVDVPAEITIHCVKDVVNVGLFIKRQEETGFFRVDFEKDHSLVELIASFEDGDICYRVGELAIPITNEMISQGFYIKVPTAPKFVSRKKGLIVKC